MTFLGKLTAIISPLATFYDRKPSFAVPVEGSLTIIETVVGPDRPRETCTSSPKHVRFNLPGDDTFRDATFCQALDSFTHRFSGQASQGSREIKMARSLLGVVPWLPRGRLPAAYLAALGLVIIQVGIGIIMKVAQTGESYSFSPSGSVAISESCKLLLSTLFFLQECKRRSSEGRPPSTLRHRAGYLPVPVPELPLSERSSEDEKRDTGSVSSYTDSSDGSRGSDQVPAVTARLFWSYIQAEVSTSVRWGYCNLALLYVLINNTVRHYCGNSI